MHACICIAWFPNCFFLGLTVQRLRRNRVAQRQLTWVILLCLAYIQGGTGDLFRANCVGSLIPRGREPTNQTAWSCATDGGRLQQTTLGTYFSGCFRISDDMSRVSLSEYYGVIQPLMPQAHLDRNLPLAVARFLRVTVIHCRGSDSGPRYERLLWVAFVSRFCESKANCVLLNSVMTTLLIVSQQHRAPWSGMWHGIHLNSKQSGHVCDSGHVDTPSHSQKGLVCDQACWMW
jgi:hypothetical protein